jgi:hypothetical protein
MLKAIRNERSNVLFPIYPGRILPQFVFSFCSVLFHFSMVMRPSSFLRSDAEIDKGAYLAEELVRAQVEDHCEK